MIFTTMCYIQKENQTLMLHRTKKENDVNGGKWIGVGGKFEEGESAEECMKREIYEETGLTALNLQLHGFVVFPELYHGQDEGMFIYTCHDFTGKIHECDEGDLQWINNEDIPTLSMWEGDYHFFEWIQDGKFHSAKIHYQNDKVIDYQEHAY